tara:strand:+ start:744 stop:1022 length:279 start_codon:yes stop_codon:yes gene_type:complete
MNSTEKSKINVILDIELTFPFTEPARILSEFANLWGCKILNLSSIKGLATMLMPWAKFKIIFGENPKIGKYQIPANTEHFISAIEVSDIETI